ncbi:outer membrane protein Iml2/Tetratricopeptide repeat protein 39 [Lactifluus subvellereus]|nr:outer membrane protein Iml2/Tetratricopeptide repeat protein 39 [Lactifluus subvellereus]
MLTPTEEAVADLKSATVGFDHIFSNELDKAEELFKTSDSALHLLGSGACAFLQAALSMETGLILEASNLLEQAEAGAKKQLKSAKNFKQTGRFPAATEWELIYSDCVILLGLTYALSESYMGYLQCLYSLNNAHSRYAKLYKIVFPNGLDNYDTPTPSNDPSRHGSLLNVAVQQALSSPSTPTSIVSSISSKSTGFFSRLGLSRAATPSGASTPTSIAPPAEDGPIEDLIVSGTAFGHGLFNLVLSLLPAKVKSVVGFFGFNHDRKLALRALAVSANGSDVHSVFAGLALMTYYGVVLLISGYQADEKHILKQYRAIVDKLEAKYPTGSLWILNRAKILRMSGDSDSAITTLQAGLAPDRTSGFLQADALLVFELAWVFLAQRRYEDAAKTFLRMTEVNTWSHATYYFIAAGCYWSLGNFEEAQRLLEATPAQIDKRKIGNKDLPTEVFIKKKLAFWKAKHVRRTGSEKDWVQSISISPAEEMAIFWNTHARITPAVAQAHIATLLSVSPPVTLQTPFASTQSDDTDIKADATMPTRAPLDTPDELALRALLLGIMYRAAGHPDEARGFLRDAHARHAKIPSTGSTWIGGVALFELAVLELREAQRLEHEDAVAQRSNTTRVRWVKVLKEAGTLLDAAMNLSGSEVDLSSRLESRVAMLRDEIALKRDMLGQR